MTERWRVLLIGDATRSEFCDARAWLASHTDLQTASTLELALASVISDTSNLPDAVVVCQTRPGEFSATQIESLHCVLPLARLVALLGSLCEGEPRSGKPWPGVNRVYWYDWRPRFEQEFGAEKPRQWKNWDFPRTATDVEASLYYARSDQRRRSIAAEIHSSNAPTIAIRAQNMSTFQGLADACRLFGYRPVAAAAGEDSGVSGADLLLWDGESLDEPDSSKLAVACERFGPKPVIVLLGFPRSQDHRRAAAAGAAAVLAKPFNIEDLCWHFDALMPAKTLLRRPA